MSHSVHDSASKDRQRIWGRIEQHRDSLKVGLEAAKRTSIFIQENDIANLEKQSGQRLSIVDFESRVQKLCPSILFRTNPLTDDQARLLNLQPGATTRRMLQVMPDGKMKDLAGFQNQAMLPEFTVVLVRQKRVPVDTGSYKHIRAADGSWVKIPYVDGKDIPKYTETKAEDGSRKFVFDKSEGPGPGFEMWNEPAGTLVGWRSLLARLVGYHLLTPDQVEREFGTSSRASWAVRMGKRDIDLPI